MTNKGEQMEVKKENKTEDKTLMERLLSAQKEMGTATKDGENPHFGSSYSTLESVIDAVKGPLNRNGIFFSQQMDTRDQEIFLITALYAAGGACNGERIQSITPVISRDPKNPQAMGSGITYAKRYGLMAICGIPSEDDDGNAAAKQSKKPADKPSAESAKPIHNIKRVDLSFFDTNPGKRLMLDHPTASDLIKYVKTIRVVTDEDANEIAKKFEAIQPQEVSNDNSCQ